MLVLTGGLLSYRKSKAEHEKYLPLFQKGGFDPETVSQACSADLPGNSYDALPEDRQNLVVYRGFTPFVGAGIDIGGWSFSVALDKAKEGYGTSSEPTGFALPELYQTVEQAVGRLRLEGIDVRDVFFVNGTDIRMDRRILPHEYGRPTQFLSDEQANEYRLQSDPRIRCYKRFVIQDWGGEIVVSSFLRCSFRGKNLLVEFRRYVLTPLADEYRRVDSQPPRGWQEAVADFAASLIGGPFRVLVSPFLVLEVVQKFVQDLFGGKYKQRQREIEKNPLFDYGTDSSYRQRFTNNLFVHYFQMTDADVYGKLLERETLDCLVAFLDDHGIDTSDIKERQTTILNSGVIVHGGDVKAESLAVGAGAQAVKSSRKLRFPKMGAKGSVA